MSFSEPVCIASGNEIFVEQQCSLESGNFQELEQFWDEEKQRLNDFDVQKPITNSWEEHLLNDDSLMEPAPKKELKEMYQTQDHSIMRGETIKDIPTSYVASGFEPHEMIVIGTYVDKNITPGFRYKVRKNLSQEHLFNGKALSLENIGLGYGKRITFQGDTLNDNTNYFWSDSRGHGFGFTLQTLRQTDTFTVVDSTGRQVGRTVVNCPATTADEELTTVIKNNGTVEKKVRLNFTCDVTIVGGKSNVFKEDVEVRGIAVVVKNGSYGMAKVQKIVLEDFVVEGCHLLPEE